MCWKNVFFGTVAALALALIDMPATAQTALAENGSPNPPIRFVWGNFATADPGAAGDAGETADSGHRSWTSSGTGLFGFADRPTGSGWFHRPFFHRLDQAQLAGLMTLL